MLLGDLIYNDDFDVNCNYAVYENWNNDGEKCLWDTETNGWHKPYDVLLDRKISYITLTNYKLIIEVK